MRNYFEKSIRIVIMAGLVALVGCDKDEASPIKKEELTSGTGKWNLTALTASAPGQKPVDVYADMEDCETDDISYFGEDGVYQLLAGASKCDSSEPTILETGTWEINGKHLIIEIDGEDPETVDIILLNSTTLKTVVKIDASGVAVTITATFTKQP